MAKPKPQLFLHRIEMIRAAQRLRIQYASDLHLEFLKPNPATIFSSILKPTANLLALAGDVGNPNEPIYSDFLKYCSQNWESVFVVAGNHEFYSGNPVQHQLEKCNEVALQFENVHFLHRRRVDLSKYGVSVLGTTLWFDTPTAEKEVVASRYMNDFKHIRVMDQGVQRLLHPADTNKWFWEDVSWLHREILANAEMGIPTIVITHHLPSFRFIASKYKDSPLNFCFASRVDRLLRDPVRAWICGHSHTAMNLTVETPTGHILGGLNPKGYPSEEKTGYSPQMFLEISTEPVPVKERDALLVRAAVADPATVDGELLAEEWWNEPDSQSSASPSQSSLADETQSDVSFE
jgi:hypothetical protein